jgi:LacI family transcriptional regulator
MSRGPASNDFDPAESTSPPLSAVRQPAHEMDRVAASPLFERIERGESPQTSRHIVLHVEIVLWRSCGCKRHTAVVIN